VRITVYNEKGFPVETVESALAPPYDREGVFYVEYESFDIRVVTRVERRFPEKEAEKIVAVKHNGKIMVFDELPEKLAERLGVGKEEVICLHEAAHT